MTSAKEVKIFDPLFPPVWMFLISIDTPPWTWFRIFLKNFNNDSNTFM